MRACGLGAGGGEARSEGACDGGEKTKERSGTYITDGSGNFCEVADPTARESTSFATVRNETRQKLLFLKALELQHPLWLAFWLS